MKKNEGNTFSVNTPQIEELAEICKKNNNIEPESFAKYNVKRGLRDEKGQGVLTGLTEIAEVKGYTIDEYELVPCPGQLFYRGYNVEDLTKGFFSEHRFGFEEITYLLMFGQLPDQEQVESFSRILGEYRELPTNFVRDVVLKAPSKDMMNTLMRSILTLYAYDDNPDDTSVQNVLRQCLQIIAVTPLLAVYGYHAYQHYNLDRSLVIHQPKPELSMAETIFQMLREDGKYTKLEARILDLCLVLHADHGGGNNSAFTTRVVTSTMTDTYSSMAAALASLKGPRHGGANIKVVSMMGYMMDHIQDWNDDDEIKAMLLKILGRKCFDREGLIYGVGHAVYSISDPRAKILKIFTERLAKVKGCEDQFNFYKKIEELAPEVIMSKRHRSREKMCVNVDFYSGFVYKMLGLPIELYTPIFAIARMSGWSAHRLEEIVTGSKIIRPAYKSVSKHSEYVPLKDR